MKEEWQSVVGYVDLYKVSNKGKVLSNKFMKTFVSPDGYERVSLCKNGKKKKHFVRTLVLRAFVGPCQRGMQACHNDGYKLNNRLTNLRWDTATNNNLDKRNHGTNYCGEAHHSSKLTETDVRLIRHWLKRGFTQRKVAKAFDVSQEAIQCINSGRSWGWLL